MCIKNQKIITNMFCFIVIISFVFSLTFMTNYYHLYSFGTSEMYEMYKIFQIFNKAYFNEVLMSIIFCIVLVAGGIKRNKLDIKMKLVTIIISAITIYRQIINIGDLNTLKTMYLGFDYSTVPNYIPTVSWFNAGLVISVLLIVISLFLGGLQAFSMLKKGGKTVG